MHSENRIIRAGGGLRCNIRCNIRTLEESHMTFQESTVAPRGRPGDMDLAGDTPRVRDSQKQEIGNIEMGYGTRSERMSDYLDDNLDDNL